MRISDWSSDVCSSDLEDSNASQPLRMSRQAIEQQRVVGAVGAGLDKDGPLDPQGIEHGHVVGKQRLGRADARPRAGQDRKSVVTGQSVSVRVDLGGRRFIKKKTSI